MFRNTAGTFFVCVVMIAVFLLAMALVGKPQSQNEKNSVAEAEDDRGDPEVENPSRDLRSAIVRCVEKQGLEVVGSHFDMNTKMIPTIRLKVIDKGAPRGEERPRHDLETALDRCVSSHGYYIISSTYDMDNDQITGINLVIQRQ